MNRRMVNLSGSATTPPMMPNGLCASVFQDVIFLKYYILAFEKQCHNAVCALILSVCYV